jgi:hypothetical protein
MSHELQLDSSSRIPLPPNGDVLPIGNGIFFYSWLRLRRARLKHNLRPPRNAPPHCNEGALRSGKNVSEVTLDAAVSFGRAFLGHRRNHPDLDLGLDLVPQVDVDGVEAEFF